MDDRSLQLAIIVIVFLSLAVIFVSLRLYVRIRLQHFFRVDDALSALSLVRMPWIAIIE
jgi:hypothetical protein